MKEYFHTPSALFVYLFFFAFAPIKAQNIGYARKVVDTLSSGIMYGRGYSQNGLRNAQKYIEAEFKKNGLSSFSDGYLQEFKHPVNAFPGSMKVETENKILSPGKDFLVSPHSQGVKGEFQLVWLTDSIIDDAKKRKKFIAGNYQNSAIIVDTVKQEKKQKLSVYDVLKELKTLPAVILFTTEDKLTWSVSQHTQNIAEIIVLKNVLNKQHQKLNIDIENNFIRSYPSNNIIGQIKGKEQPDSFIVFSAHYDHLGLMGKGCMFPGANDNASGIAMLLNLAEYYSKNPHKYSIVFIAFAGEEAGLLGSQYFTEHPLFELSKIKFLVNMDIVGTGDEGITVVNGSVHKEAFDLLTNINSEKNYLRQIKSRGKAMNSDHYFFSEKEVPAFFIYTMGGISAYHDVFDKPETLPLSAFENLFKLITTFAEKL